MTRVPVRRWPRYLCNLVRYHYLWWQQGRPRDVPIVMKDGDFYADQCVPPHGSIENWWWNSAFMTRASTAEDLWDRLSSRVPVQRVQGCLLDRRATLTAAEIEAIVCTVLESIQQEGE